MTSQHTKATTVSQNSVIELLSLFESGEFSQISEYDDPHLKPIVDKLNEMSRSISAQSEMKESKNLSMLNEMGMIAKIGGWELEIATGELNWTDETFRILEVEKKEDQNPKLPEGLALFTPDSAPIIDHAVKQAIEFGIPYDLELQALTAKGKVVWVQTNGKANLIDGRIKTISGTIQDISDRKQKELEKNIAAESLGFGHWEYDPFSRVFVWDKGMYDLYEVDEIDFSGTYEEWENFLTPETKQKVAKELELALNGEKNFNTELEIKLKNGDIRYISARGIVIYTERKNATKIYGLNWDVSERVNRERELEKAKLKLIQASKFASLGELSASIAHEINNPLTIIAGILAIIDDFKENPKQLDEKISIIQKSCDRISKIVSGLKKFSRTDVETNFGIYSLSEISKEVMVLTLPKSKAHETQVILECEIPAYIKCGEIEIEQVLLNLINNGIDAVKFNVERWVKISIYEVETQVVMRVMDSGSRIPEYVSKNIFDPFFTTKKVGEGTGLGLSITQSILEDHQATIKIIESAPNTCFEIRFPKPDCL
jgi:signal transduction histidine kinase